MTLTSKEFEAICKQHDYDDGDAERACDFLHDLLSAEVSAIEAIEPEARNTLKRVHTAANEMRATAFDICSDRFGE